MFESKTTFAKSAVECVGESAFSPCSTDLQTKDEVLRFTRALFGLAPSLFLLGGDIQHHLENFRTVYPEIVSEIEKSLYVDDLISGGEDEIKAKQLKSKATEIFSDATFSLHKWHSNVREIESPRGIRETTTWSPKWRGCVHPRSFVEQRKRHHWVQLSVPKEGYSGKSLEYTIHWDWWHLLHLLVNCCIVTLAMLC